MFWGLELEPEKTYKSKADKSFHISMACVQPSKCANDGYVSFMFCQENRNFILCNLHRERSVQVQLDLNFAAGDAITFKTTGAKNKVYLSGYLIDDDNMMDDEDDLFESDDETVTPVIQNALKQKKNQIKTKETKLEVKQESSDDEDDEMDDDDDEEEEGEEAGAMDDEDSSAEEDSDEDAAQVKEVSPVKKKNKTLQQKVSTTPVAQINGKTPKSDKKNKGQDTPTAGHKGDKSPAPVKRVLEGGVLIEEIKVGTGAPAKPGKMLSMYYSGRLKSNNKQFDAVHQGPGFKFRLGKGEVIKGWDIGINGMKIGGKRKIIIPPALAYGSKGSLPQIPPNAQLVFEVELKGVS